MTKRQATVKALCEEMGWDFWHKASYKLEGKLSVEEMEQILDRLQK